MSDKYILVGTEVFRCASPMMWARWFHDADRRVKWTAIPGGASVSTVFLGINHNFDETGPPLLFETMVFHRCRDGRVLGDDEQERCSTWDEAIDQHDAMVAKLSKPTAIIARVIRRLWWALPR